MELLTQTKEYQPHPDFTSTLGVLRGSSIGLPDKGAGKKSFLVFKHNKYLTIPTASIAYFCVKHETTLIVSVDRQEYFINYSLEQVQHLLPEQQFFRLNRQYLVNFNAIKEAEHYFARKLLVNLIIPVAEKLLVSKEKANLFLQWMENR